jgi:hypothetical protein
MNVSDSASCMKNITSYPQIKISRKTGSKDQSK